MRSEEKPEYLRIVAIIERNGKRFVTCERKCLKVSIYQRGKLTHQDSLLNEKGEK